MKLLGNYLSPYVRRVAISLNALGLPFELQHLFVFKEPETVRKHNPVARIPALVLDDGEVLVESYAILDWLDEVAGPESALTPPAGAARRRVMQATAIGVASMEKAQWAFYEGFVRPEAKVHQPWIEHNETQVLGGLGFLETLAEAAGANGWLAGTDRMSQADITGAVAYSFVRIARPALPIEDRAPHLARFAKRCEALEVFQSAPRPDRMA